MISVRFHQHFRGRSSRRIFSAATVLLLVIPVVALPSNTIELEAVLDTTLYQTEMDMPSVQNEFSNGKGIFLFSGRTGLDAGFRSRRALFRFDLTTLPEGAEILGAQVILYLSRAAPGAPPSVMTLHRVTRQWGEGLSDAAGPEGQGAPAEKDDATWFHNIYDSDLWGNAGGDFIDQSSSSTTVGSNVIAYSWGCTKQLVDELNAWLEQPDTNFGWLLKGFEDGARNARRFHSREHPDAETRPRLLIEYSTPETLLMDGFESQTACK